MSIWRDTGGDVGNGLTFKILTLDGRAEDTLRLMEITVHLYASLAEAAGTREITIGGLAEPSTVAELGRAVFERIPALAALRESVIYAVNAEYVQSDFPIRPGDDVALIPPVSGGADSPPKPPANDGEREPFFRITSEVLDVQALHDLVLRPEAGAVSLFVGVVRDNNLGRAVDYLEYEAYPAMATKVMRRIADEIRERWEVTEVAMAHRTGRLQVGEASVVIAVSSPHRQDGIAACHYGIDRLKQIVPIWKKEVWTDGEHWIEGSLTPQAEAKPAQESSQAPAGD